MSKDLHSNIFDESTQAKLAIFRDYLGAWLPVFLMRSKLIWTTINIFDFFAGPGSDIVGNKGTPLIIFDELRPYFDTIIARNLKVNVYFNEYDKNKAAELKTKIDEIFENKPPISVVLGSENFKECFESYLPHMKNPNCANLLFLDQSGIKHISEEIFQQVINLKTTDFLFFISSSTIKRFSEHPAIVQYIKLDNEQLERTPYYQIHRLVLDYYKSLTPLSKEYYLGSFSLKKNSNLYGLIFGSGNPLGIEKFLRTCWKLDPDRGEANFDIDEDHIIKDQTDLFTGEVQKPKKVDLFESDLRENILNGNLINNRAIYLFTLSMGFIPISHAKPIVRKLISEGKIAPYGLKLSNDVYKNNPNLIEIVLK